MEKFRWGFIGAGEIARRALYPAISKSSVGQIVAVASRDQNKALTLSPNGVVYTNYEELLSDPMVEGVYISLPNSLHVPLSIQAMQAGKHVLCEKPLAMNESEVQKAIAISKETGKMLVEASWYRWHPRTQRIQEIIKSGILGRISRIRTCFTFNGMDESNIRHDRSLGGGMIYDLGPYSIASPLWIMGFPEFSNLEVRAVFNSHGVDETTRVNYSLGETRCEAVVSCVIQMTHWLIIEGEFGSVRTGGNDAFAPHNMATTLQLDIRGNVSIEHFEPQDPFQLMSDAFARRARGEDSWVMPLSESLRFSQLFDASLAKIYK